MRTQLVDTFYDTLDYCFRQVLGELLGERVRISVYEILQKNGIEKKDVANRFDETVEVMTRSLGTCFRVVIHRTIVEMYRQYSQRMDFSYEDSLRDQLMLLKESAVTNHLVPRRLYESSTFDSLLETAGPNVTFAYSSLYPLKKGINT